MMPMPSSRFVARPYPALMPMQPNPSADTSNPLLPNVRFSIALFSPRERHITGGRDKIHGQLEEQARAEACASFRAIRPIGLVPGGSSDIDMRPGHLADGIQRGKATPGSRLV